MSQSRVASWSRSAFHSLGSSRRRVWWTTFLLLTALGGLWALANPLFAAPGGRHLEPVALHEQGLTHGADVWPQVTPRPLTMQFTMADAYSLNTGQVFGELLKVSRSVRLAAYRDPAWRAEAAADLEESQMKPRWDTFEVSESQRFPELQGRRVNDLARERGLRHPRGRPARAAPRDPR